MSGYAGILMLCHYSGNTPYETDFTGNPDGFITGQTGTPAGGVIYRPGKFGKGVQLAAAATNLVTNPSVGLASTNWTLSGTGTTVTRITTDAYMGVACAEIATADVSAAGVFINSTNRIAVTAGSVYSASLHAKLITAGTYQFRIEIQWYDAGGSYSSSSTSSNLTMTSDWSRFSFTATAPAGAVTARFRTSRVTTGAFTYHADAAQFEAGSPTPYLDGSLGTGYAWTGTAHASTSTRTAATLTYTNPAQASAGSVGLWWLPACDNTGPTMYLFSEGSLKAYFNATDDKIYFSNGTNTISTAALTFSANVIQFLTFAWGPSGLRIYRNGALAASGTTHTAPTLGATLYVGSDTAGANQANGVIDELAIYDYERSLSQISSAYVASIGGTETLLVRVASGPDDGNTLPLNSHVNYYSNTGSVYIGYAGALDSRSAAIRLTGATLPAGVALSDAYIILTSGGNSTGSFNFNILAENSASPTPPVSLADYNARTCLSDIINWSSLASWSTGVAYQSPDIFTLVQSIMAISGYAGILQIFIKDNGSTELRTVSSYDDNPLLAPYLLLGYDSPPPYYRLNLGTIIPGIAASWQRQVKRKNDDGTITYQPYALHTWDIPVATMDLYLELLALKGTAFSRLITNDIDNRNIGRVYNAGELINVIPGQQVGRRMTGLKIEFRVDV